MISHKRNDRWNKYLSLLEIAPIVIFVLVRMYDFDMPKRIHIGAGLSILVFGIYYLRNMRPTPLYFGTNLFFVFASIILILPFPSIQIFFLELREVGMFLAILIVGLVWLNISSTGLFPSAQALPETKKYSWILLGVYASCPAIAQYFKGDENMAGSLPFALIIVADKLFSYLQNREMKRNLAYVE